MGVLNLDIEKHLLEHEVIALGIWKKNGVDIYYLDGKVGIGTSTPLQELEVAGTSPQLRIRNTGTTTNSQWIEFGHTDAGVWDRQGFFGYGGAVNVFSFWNEEAGGMLFATSNLQRMSINAAGKVGIGTDPTYKVHIIDSEGPRGLQVQETYATGTVYGEVILISGASTINYGLYVAATGAGTNYGIVVPDGNVGIGTTTPSYALEVNTDSAGKPGAGGLWTVVSDERIKENVNNITNALDIINQLRPVSFNFIKDYEEIHKLNNTSYTGFIAQEYEKIFPDAVKIKGDIEKVTKEAVKDEDGMIITPAETEVIVENAKDLNAGDLIPYLVKAVQELSAEINQLKNGG